MLNILYYHNNDLTCHCKNYQFSSIHLTGSKLDNLLIVYTFHWGFYQWKELQNDIEILNHFSIVKHLD